MIQALRQTACIKSFFSFFFLFLSVACLLVVMSKMLQKWEWKVGRCEDGRKRILMLIPKPIRPIVWIGKNKWTKTSLLLGTYDVTRVLSNGQIRVLLTQWYESSGWGYCVTSNTCSVFSPPFPAPLSASLLGGELLRGNVNIGICPCMYREVHNSKCGNDINETSCEWLLSWLLVMHRLCVTWLNGHRLERIIMKSLTSLDFFFFPWDL